MILEIFKTKLRIIRIDEPDELMFNLRINPQYKREFTQELAKSKRNKLGSGDSYWGQLDSHFEYDDCLFEIKLDNTVPILKIEVDE